MNEENTAPMSAGGMVDDKALGRINERYEYVEIILQVVHGPIRKR